MRYRFPLDNLSMSTSRAIFPNPFQKLSFFGGSTCSG